MTKAIDIKNVGPIAHITIPVPEGGGVVIFKGINGSGKTMALDSIEAAVSGQGKVPVRDGQLKGEVQAHGVTLRLGRSTRRSGEAEVSTLEGKLSVTDLVDPGIKSPEAADAVRIKALVALTGAEPNPTFFAELIDGTADIYDSHEADDLVTMASRVKRALESAARSLEAKAESAGRDVDAATKAGEGADTAWARPEEEVNTVLEEAVEARAALRAKADAAQSAATSADEAAQLLQDAEGKYSGPTAADAVLRREAAGKALREAEANVTTCLAEMKAAAVAATAAHDHDDTIGSWRASIATSAAMTPVHPDALRIAERDVNDAREQVELAGEGRRAVLSLQVRNEAKRVQENAEISARLLRDRAAGTDEVLSGVIARAGIPLRVEPIDHKMRLVIENVRGTTPFGELSPGERWRIALDIAANALGAGGELTIRQEAWEAMDPDNKAAVAAQLKDLGIIAYTAQADAGPLRAEPYASEIASLT